MLFSDAKFQISLVSKLHTSECVDPKLFIHATAVVLSIFILTVFPLILSTKHFNPRNTACSSK